MRSLFNIIFLVLIISLTGCSQNKEKNMTTKELKAKLNDKHLVILDVRTPEELQGELGKIDRVINIPVQELDSRISELSKYKDQEIAVICRSGNRSRLGVAILEKHGFKGYNVEGGMIQYRREGN